jgi:sugar-specific transcriptional regulator TrmB
MNTEYDAQIKNSEAIHRAHIERLEREHAKSKEDIRIKNASELQEARRGIIQEANNHIVGVESKERCSQDIIKQLQEDLKRQADITVSNDYERSSVQQRIAHLEATVQQKEKAIAAQQANHEASRGALYKTCTDEIARLTIAAEAERNKLIQDAAIAASNMKLAAPSGGDDDPNKRSSTVTAMPATEGLFNLGAKPYQGVVLTSQSVHTPVPYTNLPGTITHIEGSNHRTR